jgi:hypothetical protein
MKGLFFIAIVTQGNRANIQTGVVEAELGGSHLLLNFDGNKFRYKRTVPMSQLEAFSFFDTQAEQQLAVSELLARNGAEEVPGEPQIVNLTQ